MEKIKLNLIPNGVSPVCHTSQNDNGRLIEVELLDGITPYTLVSGDALTVLVKRPDNILITKDLTAEVGSISTVIDVSSEMTAIEGVNECEIRLTNSDVIIGSLNFFMSVEQALKAEPTPPTPPTPVPTRRGGLVATIYTKTVTTYETL